MLNPGLNPVDYFGEYKVPDFREAMLHSLRRVPWNPDFPNLHLNPEFSWHSGFTYWHKKLGKVMQQYSERAGASPRETLSLFSKELAIFELYPYHSTEFGIPPRVASQLKSAQLARAYAQEVLLPRARAGKTLLVATRKAPEWGLAEEPGVIVYKGSEARGAHLGPSSRAGEAILDHLLGP
jgi:hypothetical protein